MSYYSINKKRKRGDGGGEGVFIIESPSTKEEQKKKARRKSKHECDIIITPSACSSSSHDASREKYGTVNIGIDSSNTFHNMKVTDDSRDECNGYSDSKLTIAKTSSNQRGIHCGRNQSQDMKMQTFMNSDQKSIKELYKKSLNLVKDSDEKNRNVTPSEVIRKMTPKGAIAEHTFLTSMISDQKQGIEKDHNDVVVHEEGDIAFNEETSTHVANDDTYGNDIHNVSFDNAPHRRSSVGRWIYRSFCITIFLILAFAAFYVYTIYSESVAMNDVLHHEVYELQKERDHLLVQQEAMKKVLQTTEGELQQSRDEIHSCQNRWTEAMRQEVYLNKTVTLLHERLEAMVGTEDTIQASLRAAWVSIEELKEQKANIENALEDTTLKLRDETLAKDTLSVELRRCSDRIIELELESVEKDHKMEQVKTVAEKSAKDKDEIQNKLDQQQDLAALLQHQLDEENGQSWFHEMKIQYLEIVQVELEASLNDSKYEISKLKNENLKLRQYISEQGREAVAALNAVAKSATHRKAEQMAALETSTERLIQGVKNEAAHAINYVVKTMFRKNDNAEASE